MSADPTTSFADPRMRIATAQRELNTTTVDTGVAWVLVVAFLVMVSSVAVIHLAVDRSFYLAGWAMTETRVSITPPAGTGLLEGLFAMNRSWLTAIQQLDDHVADRSLATRLIRPVVQQALNRVGAGTAQVMQGRDAWLFYEPDVTHVTGPGFLAPAQLRRRAAAGDTVTRPPVPDPRPAILDLHEQLARRGILLIVMPTPVKPSIHPEHLAGRSQPYTVSNASYDTFVRDLRQRGVTVLDLARDLAEIKGSNAGPLYLTGDTHWRPATVERVAERLGHLLRQTGRLSPGSVTEYRTSTTQVTNVGDTARLLDLPPDARLARPESVRLRRIIDPAGRPWQPARDADILLLGDSFTNVFSQDAMGWGTAAGLAEQLSFVLQRPLDRLSQNAEGAHAPRGLLAADLARDPDRLARTRVVIYQFATRELSQGDWRHVALSSPAVNTDRFYRPAPGAVHEVTGVVQAAGSVPRPGTVPYRDHIVGLYLTSVDFETGVSPAPGGELVVYVWSMQDDELTPAAALSVGDMVQLRITPWTSVADRLDGINRGELDGPARFAEPWWGEPLEAGR